MTKLPAFFTLDIRTGTPADFVRFWSRQYDYPVMDMYEGSPVSTPITEDRIRRLFAWKNGMPLSTRKEQSVEEKIIGKFGVIKQLETTFDEVRFNEHFGSLPIVWRVFLMHIINPEQFPIFDQHVYRAYRYLHDLAEVGREDEPKLTMVAYEQYRHFYGDLVRECGVAAKTVDDALWAFGKFLSRYPSMVLSRTKAAVS